jgi:hypothetical protein
MAVATFVDGTVIADRSANGFQIELGDTVVDGRHIALQRTEATNRELKSPTGMKP